VDICRQTAWYNSNSRNFVVIQVFNHNLVLIFFRILFYCGCFFFILASGCCFCVILFGVLDWDINYSTTLCIECTNCSILDSKTRPWDHILLPQLHLTLLLFRYHIILGRVDTGVVRVMFPVPNVPQVAVKFGPAPMFFIFRTLPYHELSRFMFWINIFEVWKQANVTMFSFSFQKSRYNRFFDSLLEFGHCWKLINI